MSNFSLNNKYLEQSKWILTPNKVETFIDCPPEVHGCVGCVVFNYYSNENYCSVEHKIKAAKQYLRSEKLKRISK